jgi:hypothetical protein
LLPNRIQTSFAGTSVASGLSPTLLSALGHLCTPSSASVLPSALYSEFPKHLRLPLGCGRLPIGIPRIVLPSAFDLEPRSLPSSCTLSLNFLRCLVCSPPNSEFDCKCPSEQGSREYVSVWPVHSRPPLIRLIG